MAKNFNIGCSGYYYEDWVGKFYPAGLDRRKWLGFYAENFNTVEINNSFYRLPKENVVKGWYARTPEDFIFTLKGSRYITHIKRLKDMSNSVAQFYHLADMLKEKLGCILWQLPPNFKKDIERLGEFFEILKPGYKNVMEFRHASWFDQETYDLLKKYQVGYCILSAPKGLPEDPVVTANFAYVRFHGKEEWYDFDYSDEQLMHWKDQIAALNVEQVFVYFNNDINVRAVENGKKLIELLSPITESRK